MTKKYTVKEIEKLRNVIENKYMWGSYQSYPDQGLSRSFSEVDKIKSVEEQVRTHMLAGHTAKDLLKHEREKDKGW